MTTFDQAKPVASGEPETFEPLIGASTTGLGEYLVRNEKLPNAEAFQRIRSESLQIVKRCQPFNGPDAVRTGLVVGYVQSGKTMSMTTVSALARDNGCRIIILLAGVTTNLLRQNATRFRETLRSASEGKEQWLIVNSEDGKNRNSDRQTLRQAVDEWRDGSIGDADQRTLFLAVLKHHKHLEWLEGVLRSVESLAGIPALILDDEADQAGLNVNPDDDDPSRTYAMIERVRAALPHHTYLQYTATPQAPLLISIDDMLSPEFAELVEPGSGYTGGKSFFSNTTPRGLVKLIPEGDRFKPGDPPSEPPQSLIEALAVFLIGCAVGRERGKPRPRSMLVHPSQRTADQGKFLVWVNQILKRWSDTLADEKDEDRADTLDELRRAFDDLAMTDNSLPPFEQLLTPLKLSLRRIAAKEVNSKDGTEVDWANADEHILVGGEKLNRGYTVEGLTVTYMPRDAGGLNADTLQQRARFFGYKQSYINRCRLYLHPDVANAYADYVVHEEDVRRQLGQHRGRPLREWRRAFFLDKSMRPTRRNVLSHPLYRVSGDKTWFVQNHPHADLAAVESNRALVKEFLKLVSLQPNEEYYNHAFGRISLETAMGALLSDYRAPMETASWYGHLVFLADLLDREPGTMVSVIQMRKSHGGVRERKSSDDTIRVQQGPTGGKKGGYPGDKEIFVPGEVTIQVHTIDIKDGINDVPALALWIPGRRGDVIAQSQKE